MTAKTLLTVQSVAKALGIRQTTMFIKYHSDDFPQPGYVAGKRCFWELDDLPKIRAWFERYGYFRRVENREENKKNEQQTSEEK